MYNQLLLIFYYILLTVREGLQDMPFRKTLIMYDKQERRKWLVMNDSVIAAVISDAMIINIICLELSFAMISC